MFVCTAGDQGTYRQGLCWTRIQQPKPIINNHAIKHSLLQQGYIGGEMEGWALFKMQEKYPRIESIIIKGISDYGDGTKDSEGNTTQVKVKLTAAKAAVASYVEHSDDIHIQNVHKQQECTH